MTFPSSNVRLDIRPAVPKGSSPLVPTGVGPRASLPSPRQVLPPVPKIALPAVAPGRPKFGPPVRPDGTPIRTLSTQPATFKPTLVVVQPGAQSSIPAAASAAVIPRIAGRPNTDSATMTQEIADSDDSRFRRVLNPVLSAENFQAFEQELNSI